MFNVSVIIPVYNAALYVEQAVQSAVDLPGVREVILIDDAYPDGALEICKRLVLKYQKVRLLQHPNGENRGPGASRNLGIHAATSDFISFLDADDWYLPNRFDSAKSAFELDPSIDGVYDATGFFYENLGEVGPELTTLPEHVRPEDLFVRLVDGNRGYFHTNAITVRRSIFERAGYFDEELKLHQDTHLWLRLAFVGKLVPGNIVQAASIRRVHDNNRIAGKNRASFERLHRKTFSWFLEKKGVDKRAFRMICFRYISTLGNSRTSRVLQGLKLLMKRPSILLKLL